MKLSCCIPTTGHLQVFSKVFLENYGHENSETWVCQCTRWFYKFSHYLVAIISIPLCIPISTCTCTNMYCSCPLLKEKCIHGNSNIQPFHYKYRCCSHRQFWLAFLTDCTHTLTHTHTHTHTGRTQRFGMASFSSYALFLVRGIGCPMKIDIGFLTECPVLHLLN